MKKPVKGHPFEGKKYYHLRNFGVDNRILFSSKEDFDRFEAYLYLLNAVESQRAANFFVGDRTREIFGSARGEQLVAIGAYSFVPHHFHILVSPLAEGGVSKFMQKLQTAYTMYFNRKYGHVGRLFHSAYQSREMETEEDLKRTFAYVHLNPASMFEPEWESESDANAFALQVHRAMEYRYSSVHEYAQSKFVVANPSVFPQYIRRTKDASAHYMLWLKYRET